MPANFSHSGRGGVRSASSAERGQPHLRLSAQEYNRAPVQCECVARLVSLPEVYHAALLCGINMCPSPALPLAQGGGLFPFLSGIRCRCKAVLPGHGHFAILAYGSPSALTVFSCRNYLIARSDTVPNLPGTLRRRVQQLDDVHIQGLSESLETIDGDTGDAAFKLRYVCPLELRNLCQLFLTQSLGLEKDGGEGLEDM